MRYHGNAHLTLDKISNDYETTNDYITLLLTEQLLKCWCLTQLSKRFIYRLYYTVHTTNDTTTE